MSWVPSPDTSLWHMALQQDMSIPEVGAVLWQQRHADLAAALCHAIGDEEGAAKGSNCPSDCGWG